jgi:Major Facilitator Superfamily
MGFISLYTLAFISTSLLFLAPLLVTLALKVNSLVGIEQAPNSLAVVTGIAALLAMVANPFFGRMSDRTTSPLGMRRPWMVIGLVGGSLGILMVALAPNIPVVLVGWCIAQLLFNALLAALVAVLPDQVPAAQRGLVSGVLGVCVPIASVSGTFPGHGVEDAVGDLVGDVTVGDVQQDRREGGRRVLAYQSRGGVGERVRRRGDVRRLGQRLVRGLDRLPAGRVGDLALGEGEDDRAAAVLLWWEAAGQADNLSPDPDQRTRCGPGTRAGETSFVMAVNETGGIVESGGAAC